MMNDNSEKWFNIPFDYDVFQGEFGFTCYICDKFLQQKESSNHYFHLRCYDLLNEYLINELKIKDICNIILNII